MAGPLIEHYRFRSPGLVEEPSDPGLRRESDDPQPGAMRFEGDLPPHAPTMRSATSSANTTAAPNAPRPGQPPEMAQESTELDGCLPNPWPRPRELDCAAGTTIPPPPAPLEAVTAPFDDQGRLWGELHLGELLPALSM